MTQQQIINLVDAEIAVIDDAVLVEAIRNWRVTPYPVEREWNYGADDQTYTCWTVLKHPASNTAIVYCDAGFGPGTPWGLMSITGRNMHMGMDADWHVTLEGAMRNCRAWDQPNPPGDEVG